MKIFKEWNEVRANFPNTWVLLEAVSAHSENGRRILEELSVISSYSEGKEAMNSYAQIHKKNPYKEMYVIHTSRNEIDIEERRWGGIRR